MAYVRRRKNRKSYKRYKRRRSYRRKLRYAVRSVKQILSSSYQYQMTSNLTGATNGIMSSQHNNTGSSGLNGAKHISAIYGGTSFPERIGNNVHLRRLWIRGMTYQTTTGMIIGNIYDMPMGRILVLLVKDNGNDALIAPGSNTDLTNILSDFGPFNAMLAPLKPEFRGKIKVLWDHRFTLANTVIGANTQPWGKVHQWQKSFNLSKIIKGTTTFNSSSGGTGNAEKNHVFIFFLQSATVGLAGSMTSMWQHRLSFLP